MIKNGIIVNNKVYAFRRLPERYKHRPPHCNLCAFYGCDFCDVASAHDSWRLCDFFGACGKFVEIKEEQQ